MSEPTILVMLPPGSGNPPKPHVHRDGTWTGDQFPWLVVFAGAARFHRTFAEAIENASTLGGN